MVTISAGLRQAGLRRASNYYLVFLKGNKSSMYSLLCTLIISSARCNDDSDQEGSDPKAPSSPAKKTQTVSDCRFWQPYALEAVAWNDLDFSDDGASEGEDFMPACAFFFYIDILPRKFPDVNNALHAA
jgi:hypothetical protein